MNWPAALIFVLAWIALEHLVQLNERLAGAYERPAMYVQAE